MSDAVVSGQVELTTPLDIETGDGTAMSSPSNANLPPDPVTDQGLLKPIPETTIMERVAGIVGILCIVTALTAMIVEQSVIVIAAGILSSIMGPYAYYQQTRLTDIKVLQETQQVMHHEVNKLTAENDKLAKNVDQMTDSVQHLGDIQEALETITAQQGQSVDAFRSQVADNQRLLDGMRTNLKSNVLQNLLSVVLRSDVDQDLVVDEAEIQDLLRRIHNLSGVHLHEDRFRKKVANKSVADVMEVIKNLVHNDQLDPSERIFELEDGSAVAEPPGNTT